MKNKSERKKALAFLKKEQLRSLEKRFGAEFKNNFSKVKKTESGLMNTASQDYFNDDEMGEVYAHIAELKNNRRVLSTEFEIFNSSLIVAGLCPEIERTMESLGYKVQEDVYFGVISSGEYNASAEKIPDSSSFLILFEDEIFTLCNQLSKIIIQALPDFQEKTKAYYFNIKTEIIRKHCLENKLLQQRFDELVFYGILTDKPTLTPQYNLQEELLPICFPLLKSLEYFVLGHEYGHIIAGHLEEALLFNISSDAKDQNRVIPAWDMEFEADSLGFELMFNTVNNNHFPFSFMGAELFFIFLDLDERISSFWHQGKEEVGCGSHEHPPTRDRRANIIRLAGTVLPPSWQEVYDSMSKAMETIVETMWEILKPKLEEYMKIVKPRV